MFQYIQEKYNYYINVFFKKEESLIMINNNIYNLSSYKHPGGSIILDAINNDATTIFYSTHPKYVWDLIETSSFKNRFQVSSKQGNKDPHLFDDKFYIECKNYIQDYLIKRKKKYGIYFDTMIIFLKFDYGLNLI